ncbi:MAG: type 4a pilus biogenesis protein PilO [Bdellovibrionota bacterium]
MDSEELIARYRLLPMWARLLFGGFLGVIPAFYTYLDDGSSLDEQVLQMEGQLDSVQRKLSREQKKRNKIPELEEKLSFTEQQLKESSKRLPDDFKMDEVLQEAASIARDIGVKMKVFDPGEPIASGSAFRYMELPISLEISGKFQQVAAFFDRLVNMEKMVHVRDIKIKHEQKTQTKAKSVAKDVDSEVQRQKESRNTLQLLANGTMVIYRAMTSKEEVLYNSTNAIKSKDSNKPPADPGAPPNVPPPPPSPIGKNVNATNYIYKKG